MLLLSETYSRTFGLQFLSFAGGPEQFNKGGPEQFNNLGDPDTTTGFGEIQRMSRSRNHGIAEPGIQILQGPQPWSRAIWAAKYQDMTSRHRGIWDHEIAGSDIPRSRNPRSRNYGI
jgi:hypothetical protein